MYTLILFFATVTGDDHSVVYWSLSSHHTLTHTHTLEEGIQSTTYPIDVSFLVGKNSHAFVRPQSRLR